MDEKPLIWTTRGNLPMDDMEYSTAWERTEDYTRFIETYKWHGEVVRESVHILLNKGLTTESLVGLN